MYLYVAERFILQALCRGRALGDGKSQIEMSEIKYEFKKSKKAKRRMMINVFPDGRVLITIPARLPQKIAKPFVDRKLPWIRKRLEFYKTAKIFDWKNYEPISHDQALKFVTDKIEKFNAHYQVQFDSVKVREYKRMWGACVARKNLVFNAKITGLPQEQADYIVVHELCHLKEFNHSKTFWKLVAETIPDYKRIKRDLKLYSFYTA